jgi:hypothetical protein
MTMKNCVNCFCLGLRMPRFTAKPSLPLLVAALFVLCAASAQTAFGQDMGQDFKFSATSGLSYSNGGYGTERNTNVLLDITTASVQTGNFKFNVGIPYMRISGRGLVIFDASGDPIIIDRRADLPPDVRTGWGDINLSGTYTVPPGLLDDYEVKLTADTKVPTGSARKHLSTGEADFGMDLDVSRQIGIWGPFLDVGYLIPGQPPTVHLDPTTSISTGSSIELGDHLVAIVSYEYAGSSTSLVDASHEMFGSLSWLFNNDVTLTGYGTVGLSTGSPNIGGGALISYGFN